MWLNRSRAIMRKARTVQIGTKIGIGRSIMGMDYYLAVTDSEAEAKLLQAIDKAEVESNGS